jgi:hypothetical protein
MKQLICSTIFLVILISIHGYSEPGNFKKGDTWKYEYWNTGWEKWDGVDISTDTESGVFSLCLDSIVTKFDSTIWYITKNYNLRNIQHCTLPAYKTDTLYTIDTHYRDSCTITNGTMLGNCKDFFSFYDMPNRSDFINVAINNISF